MLLEICNSIVLNMTKLIFIERLARHRNYPTELNIFMFIMFFTFFSGYMLAVPN